jgi:hypothetical protein
LNTVGDRWIIPQADTPAAKAADGDEGRRFG